MPLGELRGSGFIDYRGDRVFQTDRGRQVSEANAPRSLAELHQTWFILLGGVSEKILRQLIDAHGKGVSSEDVARHAGYENQKSKSFANAKGRLRTLGLIDSDGGTMWATGLLFPRMLR